MFVVYTETRMMLVENIILQPNQTPSRIPNRSTQSSLQPQREEPSCCRRCPLPPPAAIGVMRQRDKRYALPDTWKRDKNFLCDTKPEKSEFDTVTV
jgi:hypothetical protein